MEKLSKQKNDVTDNDVPKDKLSRRSFLTGLGATALTAGIPQVAKANVETSLRPRPRPTLEEQEENNTETIKELVYQAYEAPNEKALRYTAILQDDLDLVTARISDLVSEDERYSSVLQLIYDELKLSNIPEPIQSVVRDMMMYVPYVESRFNDDATSDKKAFGIMQLMPSAWEELSQEQEGEQKENLVDQVKVAGRLLEQIYRHLMNKHEPTFNIISELLYEGDSQRCGREFVGLLIIIGYFSGMGAIEQMLDGFYKDYLNEKEKLRMTEHGILEDENGVYGLFSTAGEKHKYSPFYGEESGKYVPKIIAAKQVLKTGLPPTILSELLPGY